jgi:hypothetical protein
MKTEPSRSTALAKLAGAARHQRDALIRRARAEGASLGQIAAVVGLTRPRVVQITNVDYQRQRARKRFETSLARARRTWRRS